MTSLGTANLFKMPALPRNNNLETVSLGRAGWTSFRSRIQIKQVSISDERSIHIQQNRTLGADLGERIQIMTPDINQDICFDIGDILKVIEDQFSGALKQKLVRELKHIETIETALLSESALAKDWLTPEEDEAWKDL
jgi:hypothetical protein